MKNQKPAKQPAKSIRNPTYFLTPILPGKKNIGPLKDLAQEIIAASASLEGRMPRETALVLGDQLRLINSYYSNLIEGHKTTIVDIARALEQNFSRDPEKKYAQQLCAAHVLTEKQYMQLVAENPEYNVCDGQFLSDLHAAFYKHLPPEHLYTHTDTGFSEEPVKPGELRNLNVSVDGRTLHGPDHRHLPQLVEAFAAAYAPHRFHGDERMIAMAASHHRLTWLHPYRDGNGRTARLFSGLYMAAIGINRSNLWSLSRGLSRNKQRYMFELWAADSPNDHQSRWHFNDDLLAGFCQFLFESCLDQIRFMADLLKLEEIEARIDWYVEMRSKQERNPLRVEASKLLRAVFLRGALPRGMAADILNMSGRSARRLASALLAEGLLQSSTHRAPLTIGLPVHVLPYYFPDLYDPAVIGPEYIADPS